MDYHSVVVNNNHKNGDNMAYIQERKTDGGKTHYRVQIRLKSYPAETATFEGKTDAKLWAQQRNLRRAISQENTKSYGWECDWKDEASFFKSLKSNPIWAQFHGYAPILNQSVTSKS